MTQHQQANNEVAEARVGGYWQADARRKLAAELFQLGSGYGDPEAKAADEYRLQSARHDAARCFREYHDLDRRDMEIKMLELQRSQRLATWASFAVAGVVALRHLGR